MQSYLTHWHISRCRAHNSLKCKYDKLVYAIPVHLSIEGAFSRAIVDTLTSSVLPESILQWLRGPAYVYTVSDILVQYHIYVTMAIAAAVSGALHPEGILCDRSLARSSSDLALQRSISHTLAC